MPSIKTKDPTNKLFDFRRKIYLARNVFGSDFDNTKKVSNLKMTETSQGFHFELKIAGYIKEDFNFYISNDHLIITTGKSKNTEAYNKTRHSYCYPSAYFKKLIKIPKGVNEHEILVDYSNGVLSFDLFKLID